MHAQHTYTEACDGLHEGPCPAPPVTQRHMITTAARNIIMDQPRLSDEEIDRIAAQVEQRLRLRQYARGA